MSTLNCVVCGTPVTQKSRGRPRLTCSNACKLTKSRMGRGIMTIHIAVPVWDEDSQTFHTRVVKSQQEKSSGIIDGSIGNGSGILRHREAPSPDLGLSRNLLFEEARKLIELDLYLWDRPEEQARIREVARQWAAGGDGDLDKLIFRDLYRALYLVTRDLKAEFLAEVPVESAS